MQAPEPSPGDERSDSLDPLTGALDHRALHDALRRALASEMVAVAMEESWEVCNVHIETIGAIIGRVIAEGMQAGEFRAGDPELAARCACTAMLRFFHPQMIAQCANKPLPIPNSVRLIAP